MVVSLPQFLGNFILHSSSAKVSTCEEDTIAWIRTRSKLSDPRIENYAIMLKPTSFSPVNKLEFVGLVGIIRFPAEIGYKIIPRHQGKGYISEAIPAFLEMYWGLESAKGVNEISAHISPGNEKSKNVVKKASFLFERLVTAQLSDGPVEFECWIRKREKCVTETECVT